MTCKSLNKSIVEPSPYHNTFIVLPLRAKIDDPEVYGPDECNVQHGVVRSGALHDHLVANLYLSVLGRHCEAGSL